MSVINEEPKSSDNVHSDSRDHHRRHRRTHKSDRREQEYERSTGTDDQSRTKKRHHRERSSRKKSQSKMESVWKTLLKSFIFIVHFLLDKILEYSLGLYLGERKRCPSIADKQIQELITKSAVELAQLIRKKEIKSYDLVKAYYDRINQVNPLLNAIIDGPFKEALEQAEEIDRRLQNNEFTETELAGKPFLGVPFTTKDSTAVAGKLHTLGLLSRKAERANEDAECVRLMKASGAIILATTSVPEVNKWIETRNNLIGKTNNPYDSRRSAGGSSGGEAAIISAAATAFGLGTDIGGSIRIPCFNCGIFGHKPTTHLINSRGCTFRKGNEDSTMMSVGPMSRFATDLLPIFKVLVEPKMMKQLNLDEKVDIKKLRYFFILSNGMLQCNPVTQEMQQTMFKVTRHFSSLTGTDVALAKLPGLEISGSMWRYWMTQEKADFNMLLGNGVGLNPIIETGKKLFGKSDFTMAAIYSLIDSLRPKEKEKFIRETTAKCSEAIQELLGDDGILFYPSSPRTAPFHYYPLVKFMDFHYFSVFNVLQVPVTQVPMGLDSKCMPLGIQVVSTKNNDRLCLAVAEELERSFGGWVAPFEFK